MTWLLIMCGAVARSQARLGRVVVVTTVVHHRGRNRCIHRRTIRSTLIRRVRAGTE